MIGLPKFAIILSELLVRSKGEAHLITISAVPSEDRDEITNYITLSYQSELGLGCVDVDPVPNVL